MRMLDAQSRAVAVGVSRIDIGRIRRLVPRGGLLPLEDWRNRHAGIMLLLWANVVVIPAYGLLGGTFNPVHALDSALGLAVLPAPGAAPPPPREPRPPLAAGG